MSRKSHVQMIVHIHNLYNTNIFCTVLQLRSVHICTQNVANIQIPYEIFFLPKH